MKVVLCNVLILLWSCMLFFVSFTLSLLQDLYCTLEKVKINLKFVLKEGQVFSYSKDRLLNIIFQKIRKQITFCKHFCIVSFRYC